MEEKKENKKGKIILIIVLILLLLLIGAGLIYYFVIYEKNVSGDSNDVNKEGEQEKVEKEEVEKIDLSIYDGRVLKITSSNGKIEGNGYIIYNAEKDNLGIEFQALLNDDLPVNGTCGGSVDGANGCDGMIRHEYAQKTTSKKDNSKNYGVFLYPVLCNKDQHLEKDKFGEFITFYEAETCGIDPQIQEKTSTFLVRGKDMEFEYYEEIFGLYDVVVYDSSQYWIETTDPNKEYEVEGTRQFQLDSSSSILPKNEFRKYVIEIKE